VRRDGEDNLCASACYTFQTNSCRIQSWAYVTTTSVNVEAVQNALVTYGPLVTTMDVYADFFNYHGGIYSYASGTCQGGHAILIVGYDDAAQASKEQLGHRLGRGGILTDRLFGRGESRLLRRVHHRLQWGGPPVVTCSVAPNTTTSMRMTAIGITAAGTSSAAGSVSIIEKGRRR
jgi:hypothetical protein